MPRALRARAGAAGDISADVARTGHHSGMEAPAGIAMQTPQGISPTMMPAAAMATPDSDMKVLVDMAVASGNQAAVDALMRQAQSQGIAPEHFSAMVEAARSPQANS
ncbi:unnamed protein product [Prorocentrum cordatum]|uniref:Uncharacterized protein n=1 Tax=Prorocentrum cordatum TaxID=2364126 RepID=A0ABN9SQG7_9DINO|nr:unnamed protein product [Polarella glacialis]